MQRIRKDDEVIVIAGKSKGHHGKVLKVIYDQSRHAVKVVVEGASMAKKHVKPNPNSGVQGGIVEKEMPIHISNVAVYNPATNKGGRLGVKTLEDGRKVRYFKSNGELVDI